MNLGLNPQNRCLGGLAGLYGVKAIYRHDALDATLWQDTIACALFHGKPKTLKPKTLKTLNPKTLNPKTLNPKGPSERLKSEAEVSGTEDQRSAELHEGPLKGPPQGFL